MRIRLLLLLLLAGARSAVAQIVVIDTVNVVDVDRGAVRPGLTVTRVFDAAARATRPPGR